MPDRAHRNDQSGFSLVEVLVVLVIIAIMVAAASLAIPRTGNSDYTEQRSEIYRWFLACSDEAKLSGQVLGLRWVERLEFVDVEALALNQRLSQWRPAQCAQVSKQRVSSRELPRLLVAGLEVQLGSDDRMNTTIADVIIQHTGEFTPFEFKVGGERHYDILSVDGQSLEWRYEDE